MRVHLSLPLPPSDNNLYELVHGRRADGSRFTRPKRTDEYDAWLQLAGIQAKVASRRQGWRTPPKGAKVVVELVPYWPDARCHDAHNLHKAVADGLQQGSVYVNDRYALLRDMDYHVDRARPRLELCWYLKDEEE